MANLSGRPGTTSTLGWAKRKGCITFGTKMTITAAGAIASQDKSELSGMAQVVKTATKVGRYTLQLPCTFRNLRQGTVTIVASDDAAYGANTTGLGYFWRRNDIDGQTLDGTIELQFYQTSYADAEVPSGVVLIITIEVETGV